MAISSKKFGEIGGKEVSLFTLSNSNGLKAEITNYGGIIKNLEFNGVDVLLGRDSLEEYLTNDGYFAAIIGRNSNRIENSEFELNGKIYKLNANNGKNNLHGGLVGFDKKIWDAEMKDADEPALILKTTSPDGEEGFPGNVEVTVTYTITKDNGIRIQYEGTTDADTVLNMTNHAYFNLNGHSSGVVDGHSLILDSSFFTPNTDECIPTGEVLSVEGTPFDFTKGGILGERFASDYEQIKKFGGFDHNFVLNSRGFRKVGEFKGDKTGITMEIYTDQSGMQVYSGNMIKTDRVCKGGVTYSIHGGVCFETQCFPNSLKFSHFPGAILKKEDKYFTVTEYKFK